MGPYEAYAIVLSPGKKRDKYMPDKGGNYNRGGAKVVENKAYAPENSRKVNECKIAVGILLIDLDIIGVQ